MRERIAIFRRGFVIVTITACNVVLVTRHMYLPAFVTGTALSVVWYWNAQHAARSDLRDAPFIYGFGAGLGTVFGMWLGSLL